MSTNKETFQALGDEIIAMSEVDQAMRKSGVWDSSRDVKHTLRMQQIVATIGWPAISKVGERASHLAWLLVQHADHDQAFQRACLALMKAQPAGDVNTCDVGYLEDRVCVGEGRPQLYGTQFHTNGQGDLEPFPIEDQERVDARRAELGLCSLAEYAAHLQSFRKSE
jgi:hypothetical protein